jgi:uncharacterized protein YbcI
MNTPPQSLPGQCSLETDFPDSLTDQIAQAVWDFELKLAGESPRVVSVVLSHDILVIKRHRELVPADRLVQKTDSRRHQSFRHRALVMTDSLWQDIERITGKQLKECTCEIVPGASAAIQKASLTGMLVQVFRLA